MTLQRCIRRLTFIGVARGAFGVPAPPPQGGEKNFRRNLQEKFVSAPQHIKCTLKAEEESF